jgi:hypothetical protein
MEIRDRVLKLLGTATLPEDLEKSTDYEIKLTGSTYSVEETDTQEGTYDRIFKVKLLAVEVADPAGKTIKGRVKGSQSKKWRQGVEYERIEKYAAEYPDEEEFYQLVMNLLRSQRSAVIAHLLKNK